jgi:hypothetical protein
MAPRGSWTPHVGTGEVGAEKLIGYIDSQVLRLCGRAGIELRHARLASLLGWTLGDEGGSV